MKKKKFKNLVKRFFLQKFTDFVKCLIPKMALLTWHQKLTFLRLKPVSNSLNYA